MNDPYETLGVDRDVSDEKIKEAYRKRAQETHPDKGGNDGEFQEIANAYAILKDPNSRAYFDRTGNRPDQRGKESRAFEIIQIHFQRILEHDPDLGFKVLEVIRGQIEKSIASFKQEIAAINIHRRKIEKNKKRFKTKGDIPNVLEAMIQSRISNLDQQKEDKEMVIEIHRLALHILDECEDSNDEVFITWNQIYRTQFSIGDGS